MNRIVVTFDRESTRHKICGLLEREGYTVRGSYRTGAETIRAINRMGGGLVICSYRLLDMTVNNLYDDLGGAALIMVIAPAGELMMSDIPDIVRVTTPLSRASFFEAFTGLYERDQQRQRQEIPQRSEADKALLETAKQLLILHNGMTEPQALSLIHI